MLIILLQLSLFYTCFVFCFSEYDLNFSVCLHGWLWLPYPSKRYVPRLISAAAAIAGDHLLSTCWLHVPSLCDWSERNRTLPTPHLLEGLTISCTGEKLMVFFPPFFLPPQMILSNHFSCGWRIANVCGSRKLKPLLVVSWLIINFWKKTGKERKKEKKKKKKKKKTILIVRHLE